LLRLKADSSRPNGDVSSSMMFRFAGLVADWRKEEVSVPLEAVYWEYCVCVCVCVCVCSP